MHIFFISGAQFQLCSGFSPSHNSFHSHARIGQIQLTYYTMHYFFSPNVRSSFNRYVWLCSVFSPRNNSLHSHVRIGQLQPTYKQCTILYSYIRSSSMSFWLLDNVRHLWASAVHRAIETRIMVPMLAYIRSLKLAYNAISIKYLRSNFMHVWLLDYAVYKSP